jgi:hypothetical protein
MAGRPKSFPLVRGRALRVTELNGCGGTRDDGRVVVTKGFVSVALTANVSEPEAIEVKNADGSTCVSDPGEAEFTGYTVDATFCNVDPCLFAMMTGQDVIYGYADGGTGVGTDVIGFSVNSSRKPDKSKFALELWARSPSKAGCGEEVDPDADPSGYLLLPFVGGGAIGDLTIENAAVTFTITGMSTTDGNAWGQGPYDVLDANTGTAQSPVWVAKPLPADIPTDDHLQVMFTTVAPPEETDGCVTFHDYTTPAAGG